MNIIITFILIIFIWILLCNHNENLDNIRESNIETETQNIVNTTLKEHTPNIVDENRKFIRPHVHRGTIFNPETESLDRIIKEHNHEKQQLKSKINNLKSKLDQNTHVNLNKISNLHHSDYSHNINTIINPNSWNKTTEPIKVSAPNTIDALPSSSFLAAPYIENFTRPPIMKNHYMETEL